MWGPGSLTWAGPTLKMQRTIKRMGQISMGSGSESESHSAVSSSLRSHGLYSPWNSPGQNTGVGSCSLLQGIFPIQGLNPEAPALQVNSLSAEPPEKPKNTGVSSLSFLQRVFQTQASNWGLLHCGWILYQLSY